MRALASIARPKAQAPPALRASHTAPRVQPQLKIGPVDDPLEREADRIADAVMAGSFAGGTSEDEDSTVRRACCSNCAGGSLDDDELRRKAAPGSHSAHTTSADGAAAAVRSGGAPLPAPLRSYFEPRFGRDLSQVRVHTGVSAARAAASIKARAFTLGNDIAFATGEFAPSTRTGRHLLAHELAHVAQQSPSTISRQAKPHHTKRFADRSGGGTTDFVETVQVAPNRTGSIVEGDVKRQEFAPPVGKKGEEEIHSGTVHVRFDTSACRVTLPHVFNFVEVQSVNSPWCQDPPSNKKVAALGAAKIAKLGQRYVDTINRELNGQFEVRLHGCENGCAGKAMPIVVQASRSATGANTTMSVVNRGGRGNAGTICANDAGTGFIAHEGGHQVLGHGDEYEEHNASLLKSVPQWGRTERIRTDYSRMNTPYDEYAVFHERHFRFVQVFLEAAFPGCSVELIGQSPRIIPTYFIGGNFGYARDFQGGDYLSLSLDLGVRLPLKRLRQLELELGASARFLLELDSKSQTAFLAGARVGLLAKPGTPRLRPEFRAGVTGGAIHLFKGGSFDEPLAARTSPFVEGAVGIGISGGPLAPIFLRAEAAIGTEIRDDPKALHWFRTGIFFGGEF